jgi:hypothetical protein
MCTLWPVAGMFKPCLAMPSGHVCLYTQAGGTPKAHLRKMGSHRKLWTIWGSLGPQLQNPNSEAF